MRAGVEAAAPGGAERPPREQGYPVCMYMHTHLPKVLTYIHCTYVGR